MSKALLPVALVLGLLTLGSDGRQLKQVFNPFATTSGAFPTDAVNYALVNQENLLNNRLDTGGYGPVGNIRMGNNVNQENFARIFQVAVANSGPLGGNANAINTAIVNQTNQILNTLNATGGVNGDVAVGNNNRQTNTAIVDQTAIANAGLTGAANAINRATIIQTNDLQNRINLGDCQSGDCRIGTASIGNDNTQINTASVAQRAQATGLTANAVSEADVKQTNSILNLLNLVPSSPTGSG